MPADLCAILGTCSGCRTLDEHAARAAGSLNAPVEHRQAIRNALELCAQRGLLTSLGDLVARCSPENASPMPPLRAVLIRTADRAPMVDRLLSSASQLQARTGTAYEWHVVDDSRDASSRTANREIVARHRDLDIVHHDLSGAISLQTDLHRVFPDLADEIRWLLGAPSDDEATYGRPLNYSLLRFAGRRFLVVDDDAVLQPRRSPSNGHAFGIGRVNDELRWYPSLDAASEDCPEIDLDPIAEHAEWLGMPMARVWPRVLRHPEHWGRTELGPADVARFCPNARVLFTHNHVLGDPGWDGWPYKQITLPPASRTWLAAHPQAAPLGFTTPFNWRGMLELRLIPDGDLSTTTLAGIDNRELLPPTARARRGEDCLLGSTTGIICPWAWSIELPFALPHMRAMTRRRHSPSDRVSTEPLQFFIHYPRSRGSISIAETAEARMAALGAFFLDFSSASDAVLTEVLTERAVTWATWHINSLNEQLDDSTLPPVWKESLRAWLASPNLQLDPASVTATLASPTMIRAMARDYGEALIAWPRLWSYCRSRLEDAEV